MRCLLDIILLIWFLLIYRTTIIVTRSVIYTRVTIKSWLYLHALDFWCKNFYKTATGLPFLRTVYHGVWPISELYWRQFMIRSSEVRMHSAADKCKKNGNIRARHHRFALVAPESFKWHTNANARLNYVCWATISRFFSPPYGLSTLYSHMLTAYGGLLARPMFSVTTMHSEHMDGQTVDRIRHTVM